ncbi:MAG TPA: hypothetical protein VGC94_10040, partial [Amnibacterium sp.]
MTTTRRLDGARVVVTGGARGIGAAIARRANVACFLASDEASSLTGEGVIPIRTAVMPLRGAREPASMGP